MGREAVIVAGEGPDVQVVHARDAGRSCHRSSHVLETDSSGHAFKHGPALGELAAANILGEKPVEPAFSLARFRAGAG